MTPAERRVAGLWCSEVLTRLSEYVDGELSEDEVDAVHAHLRGCDWCERFGGEFSRLVGELRRRLAEAEPVGEDVRSRLRLRLAEEAEKGL